MVAALSTLMADATGVGDLEAARVAHEAIGRLLGSAATSGETAEVIDLARRRKPEAER